MSDFSRRIANLSPEKRELLRRRMNAAQAVGVPPSMRRLGGSGPFPLSFAQQRLWFLDQLMPGSAFYNTSAHLRIATPLNAEALHRAINEIIRRHEALRTTFGAIDGQPIQLIAPELTLPLVQTDLRSLPTGENQALERATAHARQPFDLAQGPLLRTELLLLGPAECLFLLTMHHIVSDGWSMEIFFKELTVLYRAFAEREPSPLGELRIQYADFARWQRRWLEDGVLRKQLSYWKQQLAGLPTLRLPTDRPRPAVQSYRGATESVVLPKELQLRLRALSEQENATLFMVLLTAFEVLMSRYSGQEDFAVGTPIANRNWVEVEELIGFFANTLVLRADLKGNPSFRELLRRVSEVALTGFAHQHLPFEKLVEELHPARDPGRNPLFQVMFQLQTGTGPVMRAWSEASAMHSFKVERGTAQFDIAFDMWESADGLGGQIEYSTDLFDKSTIERMIAHFEMLLTGSIGNPDRRISELPLLTPEEQHLLVAWNATSRPYPHRVRVQALFEAQVSRTPKALAVISKTHSLTYGELSTVSNRLAHYLQEIGVTRGSIVGVCLPRSLEMTISLLAILKAGAAYLPLDSAYPGDRIAWMLADCQASLLLSQHSATDRLIGVNKALRVLCLTDLQEAIAAQDGSCPQVDGVENSLAYVIYTSGSTGHPKGVPVTHRALVNHNLAIAREFGLGPADRVLQFASPAFDVAAEEMFPTWLSGGIVVLHDELALAPSDLVAELANSRVTVANLPATYWSELVAALVRSGTALPPTLRLIVIGSERVSPERVALWQRHVGAQVSLINAYGVSETTITSLLYQVPPGPPPAILPAEVPVGHPIANVRAYVLDKHQQPVPVCVPGELYLAGDGLAPGYLNEAELTQERFVRDPSGREPKLCRTGDRARFLADGNLEVLGRLDQQIKLHGFRIEPAEIESALTGHPGVREAVVSVREDAGRERRLVSHIVPDRTYCETLPTDGADGEQVSRWQTLYDEIYKQNPTSDDPTFNTVGWNSTYTGLPIAEDEMHEWTANTVARILELRPRRVLEIGCGTGLLLFRIAPHCELYFGTDFSRVALDYVAHGLTVKACPQVRLLEREADDFRGLESERFDTIVLNSVVQYFPSVDYLLRVLAEAGQLLAPGGAIFVGDVRSLPLLPTYHTALELHRAPDELPVHKLRQRILKGMAQEQELVLDPMFFHALTGRLRGVDQVAIQVKEGRGQNELLQFRYDAVLRTSANPPEESGKEDFRKGGGKSASWFPSRHWDGRNQSSP